MEESYIILYPNGKYEETFYSFVYDRVKNFYDTCEDPRLLKKPVRIIRYSDIKDNIKIRNEEDYRI